MKIIFCFFGLNRCLSQTIGSIEKRLFDPVRRAGIPYEIHAAFMNPTGTYANARSGEFGCRVENESIELLGAKTFTLIDQEKFDATFDFSAAFKARDPWGDDYASVRNVCRALNSLKAVTDLWNQNSADEADCVYFYLRPDLIYHDALPVARIKKEWMVHRENLFLTPAWATHGGLNDRIACLGQRAALAYGRRIDRMEAFLKSSSQGLHAESFVRFVADGVPGASTQPALTIRASRLRANGQIREESFVNTSGKPLPLRWAFASRWEEKNTVWQSKTERWKAAVSRRSKVIRAPLVTGRRAGLMTLGKIIEQVRPGHTTLPVIPAEIDSVTYHEIASDAWSASSVNTIANSRQTVITHGDFQYAAYYDACARVIVAKRNLKENGWKIQRTAFRGNASDAHNSVGIAVDGDGFIHVAWDHHNSKLSYAKSIAPGSLVLGKKMPMTGQKEKSITYPQFYHLPDGDLLFFYRAGGSGNGSLVLNRYSIATKSWSQVQNLLIDGEEKCSPYWGAAVDRNGVLHLGWIWRDSHNVATNHDIAYARSADGGVTWTRSDGTQYALPITVASAEYAVRIPMNSNLMNSPMVATDDAGVPHMVTYWSASPSSSPRFQVVWKDAATWRISTGPDQPTMFVLAGSGTKRPPISRAIMAVQGSGKGRRIALVYRADYRSGRIVGATIDLSGNRWTEIELSKSSLGGWEPSIDPAAWERFSKIDLLVEAVDQRDGNDQDAGPSWPHSIGVLRWSPFADEADKKKLPKVGGK